MDEKTTRLMEQLRKDPGLLRSLMQSPDGQSLMARLTGGGRDAAFQQAAASAAKGDPSALKNMVGQLMQTPDGAALIARIRQTLGK